jgi:hypothetical protein
MIASLDGRSWSAAWAAACSKPCCARDWRRCSYTLRGSLEPAGLELGHVVMFSVTRWCRSPRQFYVAFINFRCPCMPCSED